ncbi:MAG: phosphoribosylanthranilate isomerase, partial [Wujia sp.]
MAKKMQKIKLCGMMRECDIKYANEAKPDYVGFVFADTRRKVSVEDAKRFRELLHSDIVAVGVFVDADASYVGELMKDGIIDMAQLHGNEDAEYIKYVRSISDKPLIKAVKVQSVSQIKRAAELPVEYLLLDTYRKGVLGGTGEMFDWKLIADARKLGGDAEENGTIFGKPYFLAGG